MTALLSDPFCKEHDTGPGHPEQPRRFDAVMDGLRDAGLLPQLTALPPRQVTRDDFLLVHTAEYLDLAEREIRAEKPQLSSGDTNVGPHSWEAAGRAAGCALAAVDAVIGGKAENAFCVVRPPGHHATPSRGMGFCVLNNVALAARHAQRRHGLARVLIVDWDVHHGNGTQDIFKDDPTVFYASSHQSPLYPGTGAPSETGAGNILNVPLRAGTDGARMREAYEEVILPAVDHFSPDILLISAGFDADYRDPLAQLNWRPTDFAWITQRLLEIAARRSGERVVSILEGGYDRQGLATGVAAHVTALMGHSERDSGTRNG
jgi:acetoin utilization deacetylase AcuC-like enzyme